MADFTIKRNNRRPFLRVGLSFSDGTVTNLSAITSVSLVMRSCRTGEVVLDALATVVDAVGGIVEYAWAVGDTSTPDTYDVEWVVLWADGREQTFPSDGYGHVVVRDDLREG